MLEIGPGTGQATRPILDLGAARILAIEPDPRLAGWLIDRIADERLEVRTAAFEEADLDDEAFDLAVSATAFHWLDPDPTLAKVRAVLRPAGAWAVWWNVFGDPNQPDAFHLATDAAFRELGVSDSPARTPFAMDTSARVAELGRAGFDRIAHETIRWKTKMTTRQVLDLTDTFSQVTSAPADHRQQLMRRLEMITDETFGGVVEREFLTVIYTAHRP